MRTFTFAMCKGVFESGWTEEEAKAELAQEFPGVSHEDCDQVCDDCWEKVKPKNNPVVCEQYKKDSGIKDFNQEDAQRMCDEILGTIFRSNLN